MREISKDILVSASEGDLAAFEAIYKATSGFVYNVALRVVHHSQDAEEVTQEVFLKIYRGLREFRFDSSVRTWIYRITINEALNFVRKYSGLRGKIIGYNDGLSAGEIDKEIRAGIEKEHHEKIVSRLLNALPAEQKACVILRNMEGLSYQEISESLKININTVRTRLKRARERMMLLRKKVMKDDNLSKV